MSWVLELESERNLPAVREGPVSSPEMCLLRDADDADVFPIIQVWKVNHRYQWRGINAVMTTTLPPSQCSDEESPCWNADMCFKKLSWLIRCDSQNDELKTNVLLLNHFLFFSFIYPFHILRFQSVKIKWHIIMRLWLSKSKQNMDAKFSVSMRKHFKNQIKNKTIPDNICCKVSVFQQMKIMTLQKSCMHTCSCLHLWKYLTHSFQSRKFKWKEYR